MIKSPVRSPLRAPVRASRRPLGFDDIAGGPIFYAMWDQVGGDITVTDGRLELWGDASLTQYDASGVNRPTQEYPELLYDGTNDRMDSVSAITWGLFDVWIIAKLDAVDSTALATQGVANHFVVTSGGQARFIIVKGGQNSTRRAAGIEAIVGDGEYHCIRQSFPDGTNASHVAYLDGVLQAMTDVTADDPGAAEVTATMRIGDNFSGSESFSGGIAGVVMYPALSAADASAVDALVAAKKKKLQEAIAMANRGVDLTVNAQSGDNIVIDAQLVTKLPDGSLSSVTAEEMLFKFYLNEDGNFITESTISAVGTGTVIYNNGNNALIRSSSGLVSFTVTDTAPYSGAEIELETELYRDAGSTAYEALVPPVALFTFA